MPGFAGLHTNFVSWIIAAGVIGCWLISVKLVPGWEREGWPALMKSLFGFVWMGFGLDIVLRFLMLSYNCVAWGDDSLRLVVLPTETVNTTLVYAGIFWVLVSGTYAIASRRTTAGPLRLVRGSDLDLAYAAAIPMSVVCSMLFYLVDARTSYPWRCSRRWLRWRACT